MTSAGCHRIGLTSFLAGAMLLAPACRSAPERPLQDLTVYRSLGSWTGRGPVQTDAFIGQTGAFRLRWKTQGPTAPSGGTFRVFLHSSVSGRRLLTVVDREAAGAGEGETHVTEDPREFFLVIEASDLEWSITLDEAVRARGPASGTL